LPVPQFAATFSLSILNQNGSRLMGKPTQTQAPARAALKETLARALRNFLPTETVLDTEEELRPYECDGLSAYRQVPLLAVLPQTVEQVIQILRLCQERQVPVVARGAGTGLSGGALPLFGAFPPLPPPAWHLTLFPLAKQSLSTAQ